ncbi:MAG: methionine synthase [Ruminococcus sp.]|nr:methionine synthase [Ruminococcus sp.]
MITLANLNREEALRYMGVRSNSVDEQTTALMDKAEYDILKLCRPVYTFAEISKDSPALGGKDIMKVLEKSEKVILIASTLGIYVDKLIRKTQVTDMAQAFVIDSMASVAIEQFMDKIELELKNIYSGYYFTRRYSPGYGDYPLECQQKVIKLLNTEKKIGLGITSSLMMNPTKSVTAVIGLNKNPVRGAGTDCKNKCMLCGNTDCPYRKKEEQ